VEGLGVLRAGLGIRHGSHRTPHSAYKKLYVTGGGLARRAVQGPSDPRGPRGVVDCRALALVAQRIEHLTTDQKVGGSSPSERATMSSRFRSWDRPFACYVQQRSTATLTATAVHELASSPWSSSWS